ncbi:MAG: hypothetical protein IKF42_06135 [Mogibacterium sp.]|nr:hypothetical protein [Mogibacterium sp.]
MTFDELFIKACESAHLPEMARIQLPNALSDKTKKMVLKLSPEEFGKILSSAINTVNMGSVESIDSLVKKLIKR